MDALAGATEVTLDAFRRAVGTPAPASRSDSDERDHHHRRPRFVPLAIRALVFVGLASWRLITDGDWAIVLDRQASSKPKSESRARAQSRSQAGRAARTLESIVGFGLLASVCRL